jgi:hypothetical protein
LLIAGALGCLFAGGLILVLLRSGRRVAWRAVLFCVCGSAFWLWGSRRLVFSAPRLVSPEVLLSVGLPICLIAAGLSVLAAETGDRRQAAPGVAARAFMAIAFLGLLLLAVGGAWMMAKG